MRVFYDLKKRHLIIAPARNGSSHLVDNVFKYNLTEVTPVHVFKSIITEVEHKTFLYRDPCIRLLSFYNQFIYEPYLYKTVKVEPIPLFVPKSRGHDLLSDFLNAKELILKNYKLDMHTRPQMDYFYNIPPVNQEIAYNESVQNIDEYKIISMDQYTKWIYLTFGDTLKDRPSVIDNFNITPFKFRYMQKIQELSTMLYKDDYELLEPNITYV
jgi:hypothetical protein